MTREGISLWQGWLFKPSAKLQTKPLCQAVAQVMRIAGRWRPCTRMTVPHDSLAFHALSHALSHGDMSTVGIFSVQGIPLHCVIRMFLFLGQVFSNQPDQDSSFIMTGPYAVASVGMKEKEK